MSGISFDTSDLSRLSADFGRASGAIVPFARKALEVTARNVKDESVRRAKAANRRHAKAYPASIDYVFVAPLRAEVGPRIGEEGSFGGILEDGGLRNRPQKNLEDAARVNVQDFMDGLATAAEDAIG